VHEWSHQLVVQFPDEAFGDFDGVVAFGDALERALGDDHEVDGHDIGLGEVNYFVLTRDPGTALSSIVDALGDVLSKRAARVGTLDRSSSGDGRNARCCRSPSSAPAPCSQAP